MRADQKTAVIAGDLKPFERAFESTFNIIEPDIFEQHFDYVPDLHRAVIISADGVAHLLSHGRVGRYFVIGHFHSVIAGRTIGDHVQPHVPDLQEICGRQRSGQDPVCLVGGSSSAAGPAGRLDKVYAERLRYGYGGFVHVTCRRVG